MNEDEKPNWYGTLDEDITFAFGVVVGGIILTFGSWWNLIGGLMCMFLLMYLVRKYAR